VAAAKPEASQPTWNGEEMQVPGREGFPLDWHDPVATSLVIAERLSTGFFDQDARGDKDAK